MRKPMLHIKPRDFAKLFLTTLFMCCTFYSRAQTLNPLQSIYFQNQYLYNPALAGMDDNININLAYRAQWTEFPGTPKTTSFTTDFQPTEKVGLGIDIEEDVAGLLTQTNIMGTYAYHVPLSDHNQKLNFGLSAGIFNSRVNYNDVVGQLPDNEITQYNQIKPYFDGEFGIAYSSNNFSIGAAIPDLKSVFFRTSDEQFDVDRLEFIALASYKISLSNEDRNFVLEPVAGFRVVYGYNDIVDAGFKFTMENYGLWLQTIYHSSQSENVCVGFETGIYAFSFAYNFESGSLVDYSNGSFELGVTVKLGKKKKAVN